MDKYKRIKTRKGSLVGKIRNIMFLSGILIVVVMTVMAGSVMKKNLVDEIKESVAQTAEIAAKQTDGDLFASIKAG